MRTIVLFLLLAIFAIIAFALIGKIIGNIPHIFDFKVDHTHTDEED